MKNANNDVKKMISDVHEELFKAKNMIDAFYQLTKHHNDNMDNRQKILLDIEKERNRQVEKYGIQRHDLGTWLMILTEEVGEVAQAMQKGKAWEKETDANNLYEELIQVSAVCVSIAEQIMEMKEK